MKEAEQHKKKIYRRKNDVPGTLETTTLFLLSAMQGGVLFYWGVYRVTVVNLWGSRSGLAV